MPDSKTWINEQKTRIVQSTCRDLLPIYRFLFHEIHSGGQSTQNFLKTLFAVERNDLNISLIDVIMMIDD